MSARGQMTQRCDIERKLESGTDPYGAPVTQWQTVGLSVPCRFWYESGGGSRTRENENASLRIHALRGILPADADLAEGDRIARVVDRRERKLYGQLVLDAVERRGDHLSVIAEEVK